MNDRCRKALARTISATALGSYEPKVTDSAKCMNVRSSINSQNAVWFWKRNAIWAWTWQYPMSEASIAIFFICFAVFNSWLCPCWPAISQIALQPDTTSGVNSGAALAFFPFGVASITMSAGPLSPIDVFGQNCSTNANVCANRAASVSSRIIFAAPASHRPSYASSVSGAGELVACRCR